MRYANLIDSQGRKGSVNALSSLNLDSLLTCGSAIHRAIGNDNCAMNRAPTESDAAHALSEIKSSLTPFKWMQSSAVVGLVPLPSGEGLGWGKTGYTATNRGGVI